MEIKESKESNDCCGNYVLPVGKRLATMIICQALLDMDNPKVITFKGEEKNIIRTARNFLLSDEPEWKELRQFWTDMAGRETEYIQSKIKEGKLNTNAKYSNDKIQGNL